jgi:hypothetical protein
MGEPPWLKTVSFPVLHQGIRIYKPIAEENQTRIKTMGS